MKKTECAKKSAKYILNMHYVDNLKNREHGIFESWTCHSIDELKKILAETLDLRKNADGYPAKATLEDLTSALEKYADKKFIKEEFQRQKKYYKIYEKLMKMIERSEYDELIKLDKNTTYSLYCNR